METLYIHPADGRLFQIATMAKARGGVRAYDLSFRLPDPTQHQSIIVTFPRIDGAEWIPARLEAGAEAEAAAYYEAIIAE